MPPDLPSAIAAALAPRGLNLVGVAPVAAYDARVPPTHALGRRRPGARSVVVVGNGGGAFWRALRERCERDPGFAGRPNPMDDFTVETVEALAAPVLSARGGRTAELAYPFVSTGGPPLSFVDLAVAAGLGVPSLLGILVHPRFGPWMALRAAIVVDEELRAPRPADGFDPCPSCPKPCAAACPAGAVRAAAGWDLWGCIEHRRASGDCGSACGARIACVLGPEERYPDDEIAYHHGRAWAAMREARRPG